MSASEQTSAIRDWLERAFEAGSNHFAYHESNRTEYSPDFDEWYEWYKEQIAPSPQQQPDTFKEKLSELLANQTSIPPEIAKVVRERFWDLLGDDNSKGQPDELSKAQERERWREISVDGLPGGLKQYLFIKRDPSGWDSNSCRVYDFAHAIPRDAFLRSSFTHWIELPS